MGIFDIFKKDTTPTVDPTRDLTLANLKVGYLVDYDLKTWEVVAANYYDWGDGDISREWQIKSAEETCFLELEKDDEDDWSLNRLLDFRRLGPRVRQHILDHGDPPGEINLDGVTYYLEEMAGGHFFKDGHGPGQPVLRWSYEDEAGEKYLGLEQYGEDEFEAALGLPAKEYQFTNILPREKS
ncbi:MAG: DUF4178 domain-containing protein [Thermodesulfobacteriota bacterium]